jgi:phage terminase large subunit-like protein
MRRSKIRTAGKRIINYRNAGFYQVLSAETGNKARLNVSGLVFDEIHAQPNRKLYDDVLTKGSGDAREQPLFFIITTAGNDKNSICYELHTKALDLMAGRKKIPPFTPLFMAWKRTTGRMKPTGTKRTLPSDTPSQSTASGKRIKNAIDNPAEENVFKQLRLNIWTSATVCWIPEHIYDRGDVPIDLDELYGRECYAGLDLSSTSDITAFVLVFPPRDSTEKYVVLPYFWLPEDTLNLRCRRDHVLYDVWERQGYCRYAS